MMATVKRSSEYGRLSISRSEYEKLVPHGYAGTEPDGTVWAITLEPEGTTLWQGLVIEEVVS